MRREKQELAKYSVETFRLKSFKNFRMIDLLRFEVKIQSNASKRQSMNFCYIKQRNKWLNRVGASDVAVKHGFSATVRSCWSWAA